MLTDKCKNSIEARSLPIECGDYRSMISVHGTGSNLTTFTRTWNQWVAEGHKERHAGSPHPSHKQRRKG
ncbi:hypothetical protein TNCV_999671 [Trichonephila clavipes]|nr:hypothetical protein TNCV_999671 [Trichonephila clavipes]